MKELEKEIKEKGMPMPKVMLKQMIHTVVHVQKQEEYDKLMQLYESGGWKWHNEILPTDYKNTSDTTTYITICSNFRQINNAGLFDRIYKIDFKRFCRLQGIRSSERREVFDYFKKNKPQRGSLGDFA